MRVITGSAKGRRLKAVPGGTTRPITDRAKEALFSIIGDWIVDARVLDLFGGTGAVGIEALSRGAAAALFVDKERLAVQTIRDNLRTCELTRQGTVVQGDSFRFLDETQEAFDLIYVAPPQYQGMWRRALEQIDARPALIAEYGAVIVQIHPREEEALDLSHLEEYDRRKYGSVLILFYAAQEDLSEAEAE